MTSEVLAGLGVIAILAGLVLMGIITSRRTGPEVAVERQLESLDRQLVSIDRAQLARLLRLMEDLTVKVAEGGATGLRIESAASGVATELAASQNRADLITADPGRRSGDAADAAAGSNPTGGREGQGD